MHTCKVHDSKISSKFITVRKIISLLIFRKIFNHCFTDFVAKAYTFLQEGKEHTTEWDLNWFYLILFCFFPLSQELF